MKNITISTIFLTLSIIFTLINLSSIPLLIIGILNIIIWTDNLLTDVKLNRLKKDNIKLNNEYIYTFTDTKSTPTTSSTKRNPLPNTKKYKIENKNKYF